MSTCKIVSGAAGMTAALPRCGGAYKCTQSPAVSHLVPTLRVGPHACDGLRREKWRGRPNVPCQDAERPTVRSHAERENEERISVKFRCRNGFASGKVE